MALRFIADPQGDVDTAIQLRGFAINRLNLLKQLASFQDIKHTSKTFNFPDGTVIYCRSVFGEDLIKVFVPRAPAIITEPEAVAVTEVASVKRKCATDDNVIENCDFEDAGYWGTLADNDFIANRDEGEAYSGKYSMQFEAVLDPASPVRDGMQTTDGTAYFFTKGYPYAEESIPGGKYFTLKNNTSYILGFWVAVKDFVYGGGFYFPEEFPSIDVRIGDSPGSLDAYSSYQFMNLSNEWTYYTVQHDQTDGSLSTAWLSFQVDQLVAEDGITNKVYFDFVTLRPGTLTPRGPGVNLVYNPENDGSKGGWYSYGTGSTITYPGGGILKCEATTTDKPSGVFSSRYLSDWNKPFQHNTLRFECDIFPIDDYVTQVLIDLGDSDNLKPIHGPLVHKQWNRISTEDFTAGNVGPNPEYHRTNSTFGILARESNGNLNGSFLLKNVWVERTDEVSGGKILTYLRIGSFEYTLAGEFTINCNTGSAPGDIEYGDDIKVPHDTEGVNTASVSIVGASSITVENWRYDTDENASSGVASYYRNELIDYPEE